MHNQPRGGSYSRDYPSHERIFCERVYCMRYSYKTLCNVCSYNLLSMVMANHGAVNHSIV